MSYSAYIRSDRVNNFLEEKRYPRHENVFLFRDVEEFQDALSHFVFSYIEDINMKKIMDEELVTADEIPLVLLKLYTSDIERLKFNIKNILQNEISLEHSIDKIADENLKHFISFHFFDIQKKHLNLLYEAVYGWQKNKRYTKDPEIQNVFSPKEEILYVVYEEGGEISLLRKDTSLYRTFSYDQQDEAIAYIVYMNADETLVYDPGHLMDQEMVICLKQLLRKKVEFLNEPFPIY